MATKSPFDCQGVAVPGQSVCMRATAIDSERPGTDKVVRCAQRTLRRAGGRCLGGERRTNSSVGRASARTTTRQCNYQDAKAAPCMCLMHADGISSVRRTNSSVGRASARTTTRQCNYQDAKAAPCMCLMHADGISSVTLRISGTRRRPYRGVKKKVVGGKASYAAP
jgi:hypothetical protein